LLFLFLNALLIIFSINVKFEIFAASTVHFETMFVFLANLKAICQTIVEVG